jgi:hypothetical protein
VPGGQLLNFAPHMCSSHWEHLHDIGDCGVWRKSVSGVVIDVEKVGGRWMGFGVEIG